MDVYAYLRGLVAAGGPAIVQAETLRAIAAELDRLQLMEARAHGVLSSPGYSTLADGARTAARIILGESGAPTAPDHEPSA